MKDATQVQQTAVSSQPAKHTPKQRTKSICKHCYFGIEFISERWIKIATDGVHCVSNPNRGQEAVYGLHEPLEELQARDAAFEEMLQALEAIVSEWEAERLEWIENRPEVLSLREKQTGTPDELFGRARTALAKAKGGGQ